MDDLSQNGLVMRWAPVTAPDGRTRMEARWVAIGDEHDARPAPHAA